MIGPKQSKPTAAEEREAYDTATTRDEGRCTRCGRSGDMHRDHRQNRMVGNTTVENLQCLCPPCHGWKTDHPAEALEQGYACPRWARPELWPARRYGVDSWILYTADGGWDEISDYLAGLLMDGVS